MDPLVLSAKLFRGTLACAFVSVLATLSTAAYGAGADGPKSGPPAGAKAIERLQANGVNVQALVAKRPQGPVGLWLGVGRNGAINDTANDENLELVAQLPEVERVFLLKGSFTAKGLSALAAMPNLRALGFGQVTCPPETFAPIARLGNLKELEFSDYSVTDQILEYAANIKGLESLSISNPLGRTAPKVTSAALAKLLGEAKGMKQLTLPGSPVDDSCMEKIEGLTALTRLWIDSRAVTPKAWQKLGTLTQMRDLYLKGTTFDDAAAPALALMPSLQSLILDGTTISDKGMASLAGLVQMTDLGLAGTRITDEGLRHLRDMKDLHNLYVVGTGVTVAGLQVVPRKEGLSMLRIGQKPLSSQEIRELRKDFKKTELFDSNGYISPQREADAMRQLNPPPAKGPSE